MSSNENTTLVIGNRWSALALVAFHVLSEKKVHWLYPTTGKLWSVFPTLQTVEPPSEQIWNKLFSAFGIVSDEEMQRGQFIREYRNKAFRIPRWIEPESLEERQSIKEDVLFGPEKRICSEVENKFEESFSELCQKLTQVLWDHPLVSVKNEVILSSFVAEPEGVYSVGFSNGEQCRYDSVYCAEEIEKLKSFFQYFEKWTLNGKSVQWSDLLRRWKLGGMIQVEFFHSVLPEGALDQGWVLPLTRESYEENTRHLMGYFLNSEKKSRWTIFLTSEEQENNQEIGKKIRRLKQALNKVFSIQDYYGHAKNTPADWSATIEKESVLLHESSCSFGESTIHLPVQATQNCALFVDFYGAEESIYTVFEYCKKNNLFKKGFFFENEWSVTQSKDTHAEQVRVL